MFWFQNGLCVLPVTLVVCSSTTFILTYVFAALRHDVNPLLPFISDTADLAPESCFFGLMTFISACAGISTMFAMYKYMEALGADTGAVSARCNRATLVLGLLSILGMSVVATFQETSVMTVHLLGAMLFFLSGVLYISFQTFLSFRSFPHGPSLYVCRTRLAISAVAALVFVPTLICKFYDQNPVLQKASAGCEWIVAFSFVAFFLTYIDDFKKFTLRVRAVCGSGN